MSRQLLEQVKMEALISQGSFTDLSLFDDASIKLIYTQSSIQNARTMADVEMIFQEATRVLMPDGFFVLWESRVPRHKDANRKRRVAYFTEEEMHRLGSDHNFTIYSGEQPEDISSDSNRVGGRKITWTIVFRKILV